MAKRLKGWRGQDGQKARKGILGSMLKDGPKLEDDKAWSDVVTGLAPLVDDDMMTELLRTALAIIGKGLERRSGRPSTDATKAVLREWAKRGGSAGPSSQDIENLVRKVKDPELTARLLGYLHLQCKKGHGPPSDHSPLKAAIETAMEVPDEERTDVLRYLIQMSTTKDELDLFLPVLDGVGDPADRARLLSTLGGRADKSRIQDMASKAFEKGLEIASTIPDPGRRALVRSNLAKGLALLDQEASALKAFEQALEDCGDNELQRNRVLGTMASLGLSEEREGYKVQSRTGTQDADISARHILALYDTYEGGLKPIHFRAMARAAPLCAAFGLDLALMGFPTDDLARLVERVVDETNIGKGGRYLKELHEAGRIHLVPCTEKAPPEDWSDLGLPVATTSRPRKEKRVDLDGAIDHARSEHPLGRVCLIMGLGRRGLPQRMLDKATYHLELTGSNVPLETSTVMGIIAEKLRARIR
jgi:hypothetical protein